MEESIEQIVELLDEIDRLASDSRGEYQNARGNDALCYEATNKIREILKQISK